MFAQFLLDFSQQKVRFAQVLAFSKVAKTEGEVFVALWASQGDFKTSRATISPQSPCSLTSAQGSKLATLRDSLYPIDLKWEKLK